MNVPHRIIFTWRDSAEVSSFGIELCAAPTSVGASRAVDITAEGALKSRLSNFSRKKVLEKSEEGSALKTKVALRMPGPGQSWSAELQVPRKPTTYPFVILGNVPVEAP